MVIIIAALQHGRGQWANSSCRRNQDQAPTTAIFFSPLPNYPRGDLHVELVRSIAPLAWWSRTFLDRGSEEWSSSCRPIVCRCWAIRSIDSSKMDWKSLKMTHIFLKDQYCFQVTSSIHPSAPISPPFQRWKTTDTRSQWERAQLQETLIVLHIFLMLRIK